MFNPPSFLFPSNRLPPFSRVGLYKQHDLRYSTKPLQGPKRTRFPVIGLDSNDTAFQTTGFVLISFLVIFLCIPEEGEMRDIIGLLFQN